MASGLDGTSHNVRFVFECPEVEPPAPIYFYRTSCWLVEEERR